MEFQLVEEIPDRVLISHRAILNLHRVRAEPEPPDDMSGLVRTANSGRLSKREKALFHACLVGMFILGVVGASSSLTANEGENAVRDALRVELQTTAQVASKLIDPRDLARVPFQRGDRSPEFAKAMEPLVRYSSGSKYLARVFLFRSNGAGQVETLFDVNRRFPAVAPGTWINPTSSMKAALSSNVAIAEERASTAKTFAAFAPVFGSDGKPVAYAGIELPSTKFDSRLSQIGGAVTIGWLLGSLLALIAGLAFYAFRLRQISEEASLAQAKSELEEVNEKLEERVAERTEELRQAMEAKSVFLTTAGHELRTPLNGLIGMTTLVLDGTVEPEQREYLHLAKESAQQLTTKVNQLLDLASLESGQLKLEFEASNIAEEVRRTIDIFTPRVAESGLRFVHWIDPELNRKFFVPRRRILEVVNNLLDNAVKFTESGSVYFTAGVLGRKDGSLWLDLSVQDTGVGIDDSVRERIFELRDSFVSLPSNKSGLGIGLAISRRICHLMGGVIEVCEEPAGARFRVLLPLPSIEAGLAA